MHFVALAIVFGSASFWVAAAPGAMSGAPAFAHARAATLRLIRIAAPVAAVSGVAWLAGTIAYATGGLASLGDPAMLHVFFFETPFGGPALLRLALLGSLSAVAVVSMRPTALAAACVVIGAALLVSQAWLGHAAEGGDTAYGAAMIATYAVHVVATAFWVGGLPPLAFAVAGAQHGSAPLHELLRRYSTAATVAVVLILASGAANTAFHDGGSLATLRSTTYGAVLLTKVSLVAIMLVLAAVNRFVLMPRLRAAPDGGTTLRRLRLSLGLDLLAAVLVLGAAAVLGITPPPR